jgi:hypothetical protein
LFELFDQFDLLAFEVASEGRLDRADVIADLHCDYVLVFLQYLVRAGKSGVLFFQIDVLCKKLFEGVDLFARSSRLGKQLSGGIVELRHLVFESLYFEGKLFAFMAFMLDRSLEVFALGFQFFAELGDGGIIGIDSLFLLPEIVLHRGHLSLNHLAIVDLLVDVTLFKPNIFYLSFGSVDERSVINSASFLSFDLDFKPSDLLF